MLRGAADRKVVVLRETGLHHAVVDVLLREVVALAVLVGHEDAVALERSQPLEGGTVGVVEVEVFEPLVDVLACGGIGIRVEGLLVDGQVGVQPCLLGRADGVDDTEVVAVVGRDALVSLRPLRCDQHDAGGGTCTVDGRSRSILEHRHRLDVVRVEGVDVAFDVIDQDERRESGDSPIAVGVLTQRGGAADLDRLAGLAGGVAAARRDHQARDGTLECGCDVRLRTVAEHLVHLDRGDGARKVGLFLHAVTYDNHGVDVERLFEGDDHALRGGEGLRLVAYIREFERGLFGDGQGEAAVEVGRDAVCGAGFEDGGADDRLAVRVDNLARDLDRLGILGFCYGSGRLSCGC